MEVLEHDAHRPSKQVPIPISRDVVGGIIIVIGGIVEVDGLAIEPNASPNRWLEVGMYHQMSGVPDSWRRQTSSILRADGVAEKATKAWLVGPS
jgi:hypothetical protein